MLENIFNFESIVSIALGSLVSFKALKVKSVINNQSPTINGDGNSVTYNNYMEKTQKNFKYFWNVLFVIVFLLLPVFGSRFGVALYSFSFLSVVFCLVGVVMTIHNYGGGRALDALYIVPTLLISILAYYTVVNMASFWDSYQGYYGRLFSAIAALTPSLSYVEHLTGLLYIFIVSFGFVMVFVSLMYSTFAYIKERDFDEVVTFSSYHFIVALIGYLLASNTLLALGNGNYSYVLYVLSAPVSFFTSFF
ncbi:MULTISPECIES: hypothetical protein [Serratia]|uniref:hypothetical protein n=1 Tax=Serratia TaxID=613 RepID=UPI0011F1EB4F|nr:MULTISPECIES: hypothetical protein [Serratia]NRN15549.1 hypothetical protein [Serratia marcescens]NRN38468.1 hypothetical protein [Serratia marcescens]